MELLGQIAFDLGWDYATFGIDVPEKADKFFCDGYRAFSTIDNKTRHTPTKYTRKWLQVRFGALLRGKHFSLDVTPGFLEKITPASGLCPVTGEPFTFAENAPTDWSVDRANNVRGYVRGNIIIISQVANEAKSDRPLEEIQGLANRPDGVEGLEPHEWAKMAQLIEPAFGEHNDDVSPIPILLGQPVALGMPVSPIAGFQLALSRALQDIWDTEKEKFSLNYVVQVQQSVCRSRKQSKAFIRLAREIARRSNHIRSYAEVWATPRIQKRLWSFINSLDSNGLTRLVRLQEETIGDQNTRIA
jgi:hypothetical protein